MNASKINSMSLEQLEKLYQSEMQTLMHRTLNWSQLEQVKKRIDQLHSSL